MKLKKVLLLILLFLLLVAGGGFFFLVYQPQAYAKSVVSLFEEFQKKIQDLDAPTDPSLSESQRAEETLRRITTLKEETAATKEKLSKLFPPLFGEGKQIHEDFTFLLNALSFGVEKAQEKLTYLSKVLKVVSIFEPEGETIPLADPQNPKVSDYQNFFNGAIEQVEQLTPEILTQEPPAEAGVSLGELKNAWQEAEPATAIFLNWINSFDPNRSLSEVSAEFSSLPPEVEQATEKITKFLDLLKKILEGSGLSGSLSEIVLSETGISQAEIENRGRRLEEAIEKIKGNQ